MRSVAIAILLSLAATAALAQPTPSAMPAPGANACLDLHRIDGKHADDDRTIIATDLKQRRFKITLLQPCFDIANPFSVISFARVANRSCLSKGDAGKQSPAKRRGSKRLAAKAQGLDQRLIAAGVGGLEVVQKAPALGDHLEQASARVVVLLVRLEVFGQVGDPF